MWICCEANKNYKLLSRRFEINISTTDGPFALKFVDRTYHYVYCNVPKGFGLKSFIDGDIASPMLSKPKIVVDKFPKNTKLSQAVTRSISGARRST
jgi:hypothetical protein